MKDKTLYDKDSIQSLSPREHVRLRAGMYIGSTKDPTQLVIEIFSNALDEHNLGHGNLIEVGVDTKTGMCQVNDNGQGFPVNEKREDGKTVLQASFDEMNTSGKYSEDGVYGGTSLGLNGVGGKACNFLASQFHVTTYRDGKYEKLDFEDGVLVKRRCGILDHHSGTCIQFCPDPQFFESSIADVTYLRKMFNDICGMCPNLEIDFCVDGKKESIKHPDGMKYLIQETIGESKEIATPFVFQKSQEKYRIDCGIAYCSRDSAAVRAYVNYGLTEQGPHITAIKGTITKELNKWAREQGLLKDKEKNLDGESLQEGLVLVFNLVAPNISYDAQTKSRVVNKDFVPFLNEVFSEQLEVWLDNNLDSGKAIIEKAVLARRATEAAKKAREAVKQQRQKKKKNKILHPDKLKDAEYLGQDSTLLVVEGLSAGASVSVARDVSKYGILMLRGKLINAFTNSETKLLKNEEIQLLLQALNIEPGNYDSSQLRYGRVAICTDSDSDGYNIGLLIATALQHFCPEFIKEERLCWLRSPLYILKGKKKDTYFFTDAELNAARAKAKLQGDLQRNKGLGSLSAEQARASMFGDNQHIDVIKSDDSSILLLEKLMGTNVAGRKKYIFENIDFAEVRE
jgi:topoisomerase-4 subunit B